MAEPVHSPKQTNQVARRPQTSAPALQAPVAAVEQRGSLTADVQRAARLRPAIAIPRLAHPADILGLQKTAGNRAVVSLIQAKQGCARCAQDEALIQTQAMPSPLLQREAAYPDTTCRNVQNSITRAWPTAKRWVQVARARLTDASSVAGSLRTHFKLDPNDASQGADLATVRRNFQRMEELFDTTLDNRCNRPNVGGECQLPDGRKYAAYVHAGMPGDGIWHCLASADVSFLNQASLIETLVHEVAHLADPASTDYAYRSEAVITTYENMMRAQAIHNGDSYSEFAQDQFMGSSTPLMLGLSTGVLLSSGQPRWVIGARYDVRGRSGVEVFDLVSGLYGFIALDPSAGAGRPVLRDVGGEVNIGVISRSADTHFFADTRLGAFLSRDVGAPNTPSSAGLSANVLLGWANGGFRAGVNTRLLFDFLHGNHAVIFGGEFSWGP